MTPRGVPRRPAADEIRRPCWYCGKPSVLGRIWCKSCLGRIETTGVVDSPEYPTREDSLRLKTH